MSVDHDGREAVLGDHEFDEPAEIVGVAAVERDVVIVGCVAGGAGGAFRR